MLAERGLEVHTSVLLALPEDKLAYFQQMLQSKLLNLKVYAFPVLKLSPLKNICLPRLEDYNFLIITSPFAARTFVELLPGKQLPSALKIISVGPSINEVLQKAELAAHFSPQEYTASALAQLIKEESFCRNKRFLFLRGDKIASEVIKETVEEEGGSLDELVLYKSEPVGEAKWNNFANFQKDSAALKFICLTSPEGVKAFAKLIHKQDISHNFIFVCIGQSTAVEAKQHFPKHKILCPSNYSYNGMIEIIIEYLENA